MKLYHLFYATALIAAAVKLFGLFGIIVGGMIAGGWSFVFNHRQQSPARNFLNVFVLCALIFCFTCCCFMPFEHTNNTASRRMYCANNLKQIVLALHNYESVWKQFPPAITYSAEGQPMHSWRVLILPYCEAQPLYDAYSFAEPWDGPNNRKLLSQMPSAFKCPYDQVADFKTGYRVVIGESTCFPLSGARKLGDVSDGMSQTIAVVESTSRVRWLEPVELNVDEFVQEVTHWYPGETPHQHSDWLEDFNSGGNYCLADGAVRFNGGTRDGETLRRMLGVNDGPLTDLQVASVFVSSPANKSQLRWQALFAIAAFIGISLLPAFWLGVRPSRIQHEARASE